MEEEFSLKKQKKWMRKSVERCWFDEDGYFTSDEFMEEIDKDFKLLKQKLLKDMENNEHIKNPWCYDKTAFNLAIRDIKEIIEKGFGDIK